MGHGNTPMLILNRAAQRIANGEADICAVTGAEAYRTEKRLATLAAGDAGRPDMMKQNLDRVAREPNKTYGIVTPVEIYPLFENAMRAQWHLTLAAAQAESASIWSAFSVIAAENPGAWIRRAYSAQEILETGPSNRKLSFPYSTLMVANNSVNQGAAIIVASYARARALGIPEDKLIFVGAGAAADEPDDVLARANYHESPSLQATIHEVLKRNDVDAEQIDHLELYSCFPCVPKHARRVADFRPEVPLTVAGGLTFAGGPIRNYMMHATAAMVAKMRQSGTYGMLFGNGGYMTEAHALVLGRRPILTEWQRRGFDVQAEADSRRGPVPPFVEDFAGPGTIETYTVCHDRSGQPLFGTIIGRDPDGRRFICRAEPEPDMMAFLMSGDVQPVGQSGTVRRAPDGLRIWHNG
jgi:acetyl-CoA C-acetyltransferase